MATLVSPSTGKLVSNVRNFLSSPNPANSMWSDPEIIEYLNEGVRMYATEVVNYGEGQFTVKDQLDITNGSETVALPTTCFIVKDVRKKVSGGYISLRYFNGVNHSYSTDGGSSSEGYFPSYSFRGNNLVLHPTPAFSETDGIEIEYVEFPDVMQHAADTLTAQVVPIFKNLIEMYAVYKAKLKQSLVNGVVLHKVAEDNVNALYASFKDALGKRTLSTTSTVPFSPEHE